MAKTRKTNFLKKVYKKKRKTWKRKLNKRSRRRKKRKKTFLIKRSQKRKRRKTRRKQKGGYCCNYERRDGGPGQDQCNRPAAQYPWNIHRWAKTVYIRTLINVPAYFGPLAAPPNTYDVAKIRYQRHIYKHMQDLGFNCYNDTQIAAGAHANSIGTAGLTLQQFLINAFGRPRPVPAAPWAPFQHSMYVFRPIGGGGWWNMNVQDESKFNKKFLQTRSDGAAAWNNNARFEGYIPTENWIQIPHAGANAWGVQGGLLPYAIRDHFFRVYYKIYFGVRKNEGGGGNWKFRNLIFIISINLAIQPGNHAAQFNHVAPAALRPNFVAAVAGGPIPPRPKAVYYNRRNDVADHVTAAAGPPPGGWRNFFLNTPNWVSTYEHNTKGDEAWWAGKRNHIHQIWRGPNNKRRDKQRNLHEAWYQQNPAEIWNIHGNENKLIGMPNRHASD